MSRENSAAIVALIVKKPRTARELADLLGKKRPDEILRHLKALEAEGLVERVAMPAMRANRGGHVPAMWRWIGGVQ